MVLAELGGKISKALAQMKNSTVLDDAVIEAMLKDIQRALLEADVNVRMVKQLKENIQTSIKLDDMHGYNRRKLIQQAVITELKNLINPKTKAFQPKRNRPNVIMFVGLQGAGKTTTVTKYAAYYQKKGWKAAVVCADTFRAGAYDQLKQNAARAKIAFYGTISETDPVQIAADGVEKFKKEGFEIIIVDTSGRHKQEAALFDEMEQVATAVSPDDIAFVMDSSIGQAAQGQAAAFKDKVAVGSVIITKLDGHAKGGGALSAVAATQSPVTFIGTGEHIEDFEVFSPQSFISRLLGFGDVEGLVDKIKSAGIDSQSELYKRFTDGEFTLRDMYEHLQNVLKLGPMNKFMDMLPGCPPGLLKGRDKESTQHLKIFMTIMDSMTDFELDTEQVKKVMTNSRIQRIARGSGRSVTEVNDLLKAYQKFEEMVRKVGKMKFKQMAKDPSAMMRPNQISQLAKALNPQVLKQMGGFGGLQNIVKQLSNSGINDKMFK
eukprot:TRINITY_DN21045_c0_g1_i1.p1 TRINITY_DN21045_c0_g1~~TRINITY_DN21045_c0_g1_i1.p1  ORF type:complete len:491 (+),score=93.65 TRINITY_DN21045_c0_g1_i1:101-1573(+)